MEATTMDLKTLMKAHAKLMARKDVVARVIKAQGEQRPVRMYESTEALPPRTDLHRHIDKSEVDETNKPPIPLSK
jgi:hypothetical protein